MIFILNWKLWKFVPLLHELIPANDNVIWICNDSRVSRPPSWLLEASSFDGTIVRWAVDWKLRAMRKRTPHNRLCNRSGYRSMLFLCHGSSLRNTSMLNTFETIQAIAIGFSCKNKNISGRLVIIPGPLLLMVSSCQFKYSQKERQEIINSWN